MAHETDPEMIEQFLSDLPINVEGLTDSDLDSTIGACGDAIIALEKLMTIMSYTKQARAARIAGNIPEALRFEKHIDSRYNALPPFLKW